MQLDEPLRDRQAEAGATELDRDGLIALKEWLEDEPGKQQSSHPTQIATNRRTSVRQAIGSKARAEWHVQHMQAWASTRSDGHTVTRHGTHDT